MSGRHEPVPRPPLAVSQLLRSLGQPAQKACNAGEHLLVDYMKKTQLITRKVKNEADSRRDG